MRPGRDGGVLRGGGSVMTKRILTVDDEPGMLKLLGMILRDKTPHEVVATNNPLEALEIVRRGGIDLVIADLKMPGLDGSELLEAVKEVQAGIPVIIITAYGTEEAAAETVEKGGFDFIMKPFRKEQILLAVDRALKWAELQRENAALREKLGQG
jgi:DNA-binding NtrC family response regulator